MQTYIEIAVKPLKYNECQDFIFPYHFSVYNKAMVHKKKISCVGCATNYDCWLTKYIVTTYNSTIKHICPWIS